MIEHTASFAATVTKPVQLRYLLYLPANYELQLADRFPLILFLHGTGERGDDLSLIRKIGLPAKLARWPDCPFIVLAPQCRVDSIWAFELDALNALLGSVCAAYRVDTRRLYLTGLSLGGTGTWYLATAFPGRFAAIAPICGRGISRSLIDNLKHTPVWAFHGARDTVVEASESERMVEAVRQIGGNARLTIYPEAGHNSWTQAYDDPALYEWFLSHTLPDS